MYLAASPAKTPPSRIAEDTAWGERALCVVPDARGVLVVAVDVGLGLADGKPERRGAAL